MPTTCLRKSDDEGYRARYRRSWKNVLKGNMLNALNVVYKLGPGAGDSVLLTFDDGPHPEVTPAVLDRLDRYRARAVFFVVGSRTPRAPWALERIRDRGHTIGNHTFYHDYVKRGVSGYANDIGLCQEAVEALTGSRPLLFRPPLGRITAGGLLAARRHHLTTVYWSADNRDWSIRTPEAARECGAGLAGMIGPGKIVLLHDDNPCVLTVLDALLPALAERGYDLNGGPRWLPITGRDTIA